MQGPLTVPIEVILNIAGFLAGDNNFGSLFNFSMMNKRVRQECLPTCFETLVPRKNDEWMMIFKEAMSGVIPSEWRFCKYVFLPRPLVCLHMLIHHASDRYVFLPYDLFYRPMHHLFPNIRIGFTVGWAGSEFVSSGSSDSARYTPFTAKVALHRPVSVEMLSSLLRYPHFWNVADEISESHPRTIQAINKITVTGTGALFGGPSDHPIFDENVTQTLELEWSAFASIPRAIHTFVELARLAPVKPKAITCQESVKEVSSQAIEVHIREGPFVSAWIEGVSDGSTYTIQADYVTCHFSVIGIYRSTARYTCASRSRQRSRAHKV